MNTAPSFNKTTAIAATDRTTAAVTPRIKLLSHGFSIDHPDPELGEQLMADALGVTDRDAMHGILTQLVKASANRQKPDEVNLTFMISMVKSIKPRDSIEAMLAQPLSKQWRACHHRAERVGSGWRQGHRRQRHAACQRDRFGQEGGDRANGCPAGASA